MIYTIESKPQSISNEFKHGRLLNLKHDILAQDPYFQDLARSVKLLERYACVSNHKRYLAQCNDNILVVSLNEQMYVLGLGLWNWLTFVLNVLDGFFHHERRY